MISREQDTRVNEGSDTEITLGVGKLLALFFCLVILCGISLAIGYSLGRNSAKQVAAAATVSATPATPATSAANKPGAAQAVPAKVPDCPAGENCLPQQAADTPGATPLTFYDSVQKKDAHPQLTPAETPAPVTSRPPDTRSTLGTGYLVQIAAVRNQDDAKLLSETLHKQQYPVIITQPGDKLFHVQVGPYADIKEAEAIRTRLIAAGYNAFLKR
jgi:cell division septation protein DedD